MLGQANRFAKGSARRLLGSLGLLPHAKRGVEWLRALPYLHKSRFITQIAGAEVAFVTRDAHSKVWCHRRHENRQDDLHEPAIVKAFSRCIGNATVFADVGGHIGYYSCIAGVINPDLKIFCFEMNRRLVPLIEANFQANGLRNATVVPSPVADKHKLVSYDGISKSGGQSISPKNQQSNNRVYIDSISLDEYFDKQGIIPDIIKIDVEGAEMDVLRGAVSLLKERSPLLFLEIHPKNLVDFSSSVDEVVNCLQMAGYSFCKTTYLRMDGDLEAIDAEALSRLDKSDMVICVPKGEVWRWAEAPAHASQTSH